MTGSRKGNSMMNMSMMMWMQMEMCSLVQVRRNPKYPQKMLG